MFRIVCFVEDKKLAALMRMLPGYVFSMEAPQPVVEGADKTGLEVIEAMSGTFSVKDVKEELRKHGLSPGSSSTFIASAAKDKIITKAGYGKWRRTS